MTVNQLLRNKGSAVWSVTPDTSVLEALQVMAEKNVGALVVLENNQLIGIFSERDYARKVILHGKSSRETAVREIMTEKVDVVGPSHSVRECMARMTDKHIRHLPVVELGRVVGLVSIGDVVKAIISDQEFMIEQLESYIAGGSY
ncbi:MAG: CBS domain-containing protein [Terriglobia bacterium]